MHYLSRHVVALVSFFWRPKKKIQGRYKQMGTNALIGSAAAGGFRDSGLFSNEPRRRASCQSLFILCAREPHRRPLAPPIDAASLRMPLHIHCFNGENQFICTGRYPGGPALISFSA